MQKKVFNVPAIILSILGIITLTLALSFIYFSLNGRDYTKIYNEKIATGEIKNPFIEFELNSSEGNKSIFIEESIMGELNISNIELIKYTFTILKLYNLHNIPFTTITPKIQIYLNQDIYSIEIKKGDIIIKEEEIQNEDIIIRTTNEEILKMNKDDNYTKESISSGKTTIEKVANDFILFSKGYLNLYKELNLE